MTHTSNIVPFGKHKGRSIEEVLETDPGYLQWLSSRPWFAAKFVTLHQTVINRGGEPEETPEHNSLQVLFLDDAFCWKFWRAYQTDDALLKFDDSHQRLVRKLQTMITRTPARIANRLDAAIERG